MAADNRRLKKNNEVGRNTDVEDGIKENQACKEAQATTAEAQEDTGVAREGEDTPDLDLGDQGDSEVTREGEDTPELGQGDRGDTEATREGEDNPELDREDRGDVEATREGEETPELDLRDRGDIKETRWITPVITKEEENPGREGDTREDEGSRDTNQTGPCLRYQAKNEEEEPKYQAGELSREATKHRSFQATDQGPRTG